jgi:hypothetical protein
MPRTQVVSLTRTQVFRATTTVPHTTDFSHLLPFPRSWAKRTSHKDPHLNTVRAHQRIKYWNIVPGDKIGLWGDKENTVHEVQSINKLSNRVFLKNVRGLSSTSTRPQLMTWTCHSLLSSKRTTSPCATSVFRMRAVASTWGHTSFLPSTTLPST